MRWRLVAAVLVCAGIAAAYLLYSTVRQDSEVVFVNATDDHKYDRALRASIRTFQNRTAVQLGIVLENELPPGARIEDHASRLFQQTRLGERYRGKGILFLWSEKERLFKIEVSYELEPVYPDVVCHRLEDGARTFMLAKSAFARRDFLTELIVTMGFHYLDYRNTGQLSDMTLPEAGSAYRLSGYLSGGAGVVGRGYAATVEQVQREIAPLSAGLAEAMQPAATVEEVVARYLGSLDLGIGSAGLPLLTEGSRYFRMEKPHAPGYLRRIRAYYQKALPYRIIERRNLAAAVFQPGHPVLPILLRTDHDGLWLVDEPAAWAYFHLFEDGDNPVPKYRVFPYAFAWQESAYASVVTPLFSDRSATPPLAELPFSLRDRLAQAESGISQHPAQASYYLTLAELLHFDMYWLEAAAPVYERVLELAPDRNDIRWRLIDIYLNTTDVDGQERQYLELLKRTPQDALLQHLYHNWFRRMYQDRASFSGHGLHRNVTASVCDL